MVQDLPLCCQESANDEGQAENRTRRDDKTSREDGQTAKRIRSNEETYAYERVA